MNQKWFGFARPTVVLLACWIGAASGTARGEDEAYPSAPQSISPDEPVDRMSLIEARLRELETSNQQLQERYDGLARKYALKLRQSDSSVYGAEARNSDGQGTPGGVDWGQSALSWIKDDTSGSEEDEEQADEEGGVRRQSGASGAGVRIGTGSGGARRYPFESPSRSPFGTGQASQRRQSGTSGPGVRVAETSGAAMGDYVEQRGSYVRDMRPLGIPAAVQFREGLQIRTSDEFFTFEFHNLTQLDYRDFSQTGDALHDKFVIPRQRWYFQGDVTPYATYYTVINRGYGSLDILDAWIDLNFAPKYKGICNSASAA